MPNIEPKPMAEERQPFDPIEIDFVRQQAAFYHLMLKNDPFHVLIPACWNCSSSDLTHNLVDLNMKCQVCGWLESNLVLRAGRLAKR